MSMPYKLKSRLYLRTGLRIASWAQTMLLEAPHEKIDAILPKERFAREDHGRYTPMSRCFKGTLVVRDDRVVPPSVGGDCGIELVQRETGTRHCIGEVRAL